MRHTTTIASKVGSGQDRRSEDRQRLTEESQNVTVSKRCRVSRSNLRFFLIAGSTTGVSERLRELSRLLGARQIQADAAIPSTRGSDCRLWETERPEGSDHYTTTNKPSESGHTVVRVTGVSPSLLEKVPAPCASPNRNRLGENAGEQCSSTRAVTIAQPSMSGEYFSSEESEASIMPCAEPAGTPLAPALAQGFSSIASYETREELEALEWRLDCMPDFMQQLQEEIDSEDDSLKSLQQAVSAGSHGRDDEVPDEEALQGLITDK